MVCFVRRLFYGWHDPRRGFLVSRYPPDAPVRPALEFETAQEAINSVKRSRRAEIMWLPPLSKELLGRGDQS